MGLMHPAISPYHKPETVMKYHVKDLLNAGQPLTDIEVNGYWRTGSARENNYIAAPFVDVGACIAVVNYDLSPAATARNFPSLN